MEFLTNLDLDEKNARTEGMRKKYGEYLMNTEYFSAEKYNNGIDIFRSRDPKGNIYNLEGDIRRALEDPLAVMGYLVLVHRNHYSPIGSSWVKGAFNCGGKYQWEHRELSYYPLKLSNAGVVVMDKIIDEEFSKESKNMLYNGHKHEKYIIERDYIRFLNDLGLDCAPILAKDHLIQRLYPLDPSENNFSKLVGEKIDLNELGCDTFQDTFICVLWEHYDSL